MDQIQADIKLAIQRFWRVRGTQALKQGSDGDKDRGGRSAVTGGGQLSGLVTVICDALERAGLEQITIFRNKRLELPGYFRPTKKWDLLVVSEGQLVAALECKSHVGPSFGNNANNRAEEAVGSAHDLRIAHREKAFASSPRPWLGWFMLLEDCPASLSPIKVEEPHFPAFPEFRGASYARRYQLLCERLVREGLYDAACLILSARSAEADGSYRQLSDETGIETFLASLTGRAASIVAKKRLLEERGRAVKGKRALR